nr:hypothetical protein OG781_36185 [Streptomyces sp. NBC_00830]
MVGVWCAAETVLPEVADREQRTGRGTALKAKKSRLAAVAAVHSTE